MKKEKSRIKNEGRPSLSRQALAMLKILATGKRDIEAGRTLSRSESFSAAEKAVRRTSKNG